VIGIEALVLLFVGFVAGACNAVAGGGIFFTLPTLMWAGLPPVSANASSAVSVWPGHAVAILGYRHELSRQRSRVVGSVPIAMAGGVVGALLLLTPTTKSSGLLIPWLLLVATLVLAFSAQLRTTFERLAESQVRRSRAAAAAVLCEFSIAGYGGYFGAGLGVLMFAGLSLLGVDDMQEANALKNLLAATVSTIAVVIFLIGGAVAVRETSIVLTGAIVGGYLVRRPLDGSQANGSED
jgi:uncharacterized membrane protein YfcA